MLLIWMAKNYSETEDGNSMDTGRTVKTTACRIPYLIFNKYG
jgi:hypothetical protein